MINLIFYGHERIIIYIKYLCNNIKSNQLKNLLKPFITFYINEDHIKDIPNTLVNDLKIEHYYGQLNQDYLLLIF